MSVWKGNSPVCWLWDSADSGFRSKQSKWVQKPNKNSSERSLEKQKKTEGGSDHTGLRFRSASMIRQSERDKHGESCCWATRTQMNIWMLHKTSGTMFWWNTRGTFWKECTCECLDSKRTWEQQSGMVAEVWWCVAGIAMNSAHQNPETEPPTLFQDLRELRFRSPAERKVHLWSDQTISRFCFWWLETVAHDKIKSYSLNSALLCNKAHSLWRAVSLDSWGSTLMESGIKSCTAQKVQAEKSKIFFSSYRVNHSQGHGAFFLK